MKAVSGLGESAESNMVIVHPEYLEEHSTRTSPSNHRDRHEKETEEDQRKGGELL